MKSFLITIWTYLCKGFDFVNNTTLGNFLLEKVLFRTNVNYLQYEPVKFI